MWTKDEIIQTIKRAIPDGLVVTAHNERGHFYVITDRNVTYPSVTGKLQILKDESLINYKMNQALQYIFAKFKEFTDENIMDHLDSAARVPQDNLERAGDIGREVHEVREKIFTEWIKTGERPKDFFSFIPPENPDPRMISAIRALDTFCTEWDYVPVVTETFVFSHKLKVAGQLDDLGLIKKALKPGASGCEHSMMLLRKDKNKVECLKCDYAYKVLFVLMDVKTSNQFKDHYFFQVALYYTMLRERTGLKPDMAFILKLSKENGTYAIEDLKRPAKLAQYARTMIRTHEGLQFIKQLRKDNQKKVGEMIVL